MVHSTASSFADDHFDFDPLNLQPSSSHDSLRQHPPPSSHPTTAAATTTTAHAPFHGYGKKQASLAHIAVPSFSAFKSQTSSVPFLSPRIVPHHTDPYQSSRPISFSAAEQSSPRLVEPSTRPLSLDSPPLQQPNGLDGVLSPPLTEHRQSSYEISSYEFPLPPTHDRAVSIDSLLFGSDSGSDGSTQGRDSRPSSIIVPAAHVTTDNAPAQHKRSTSATSATWQPDSPNQQGQKAQPPMNGHQPTPSMTLQLDGVQRTLSDESFSTSNSEKRPKSPARLGSFFGWKSSPQKTDTESPTTTFSDRSLSPLPSPHLHKPQEGSVTMARLTPPGLDIYKANSQETHYFDHPETPILLGTPESNAHVMELQRELEHVSTELAGSIKREMELEDEVERLKMEMPQFPVSEERRNSDYYSDSGASSVKFPITDPEAKIEEVEQLRRKAEQEKAQIKLDMAQRLQIELNRRRDLEQLVHDLENQVQKHQEEDSERRDQAERIEELEIALEESKRRLGQERQAKDNFEDLYSALNEELAQHRTERDNLRDQIVPQLKSRVEGLESQSSDTQALMYENSRMAQEINALKEEQRSLHEAQRMGTGRFGSIAEEDDSNTTSPVSAGPRMGLSRSGSLARSTSKRGTSLTRSNSVNDGRGRSGSGGVGVSYTAEGIKEVEDQRDALHKALKLLISRYEKQQKDHGRAVKKLAGEKLAAEQSAANATPRRSHYQREVASLKDEVTTLRKRTEDALEQKWQYEKGLAGIKMDLDRAEQETRGLRVLLQENDILAPSPRTMTFGNDGPTAFAGEESLIASISSAEIERNHARQVAEEYRQRALSIQEAASSDEYDDEPPAVAKLFNSANRMDDLAEQLEKQARASMDLRDRLAHALEKGEREQRESTRAIEEMQKRLAGMEDSVLEAQQHSETTLSTHESEARRLEEANTPRLQRLRLSISPQDVGRLSPLSAVFGASAKAPRPISRKVSEKSLMDMSKTQALERKVRELERLLREAEEDMQNVVQRVNQSQFEVAELTSERDTAVNTISKLHSLIEQERESAEGLLV